jgi:hypothetical protein
MKGEVLRTLTHTDVVEAGYFAQQRGGITGLAQAGEVFRVRIPASVAPVLASPFTPYMILQRMP